MRARRRLTGHDEYGSVRGRERDEPSTPMLETSVVADQRKTEEMAGGGEELKDNAESGTGADARCGKDEETNAEVGSTADEREVKHALQPAEGVEYQCIMDVFTLSSLSAQVWAIYVNRIKGSCCSYI